MSCKAEGAIASVEPTDKTACDLTRNPPVLDCGDLRIAPARPAKTARWPPKDGQPRSAVDVSHVRGTAFGKVLSGKHGTKYCEWPNVCSVLK